MSTGRSTIPRGDQQMDDAVYAVDLLRSLRSDRLLDRTHRAPATAMDAVRRALLNIT